jgi:hypothetical protein
MSRVGIQVTTAPTAEHAAYVAGAVSEVLRTGAEVRTSEGVMHAALDVLRQSFVSGPVSLHNCQVDAGDNQSREVNVD